MFGARKRVRAGIALLDQQCPDWHWRLNLQSLDMQNTCNCVLGQLYGHFWTGVNKLNLSLRLNDDAQHGFNLRGTCEAFFGGWWRLQRAWRKEIDKKRQRDVAQLHWGSVRSNTNELVEV